MGFPLSLMDEDTIMQTFEIVALESCHYKPKVWLRYVMTLSSSVPMTGILSQSSLTSLSLTKPH